MIDTNPLAYETVTFFEEWLLREFNTRATDENCLRVRNAAEDLISEDADYWSAMGCLRIYDAACQSIGIKPYAHW